ncbi:MULTISPECIES: permease prefix domain 1-containing protein [Desulfitobacterium]|uniref:Uncharacterized protein n=1 Tax=Desulfitobacterium dehalogenans (strain ATCC 51507 / DSM 9161 / JW/IU-DC1) TaxID=756499 RepID=I4A659_DESDJ|nr:MULTISPECIES: permease prefix domain 1-containing protein [Desulfitobacterium]AFL99443.1 hypothetical protein Desde_1010 [Desulfitobacterium dehalogenans ATCC 51507]
MRKNEDDLENKVSAYIDALFAGVGASQQLFDLKEEIATSLKEKTLDYKNRGISEEQAFKEAIVSLGDLSGLVAEMRQIGQDEAKQAVYSTMAARISLAGIIAGSLIILFGFFNIAMLYFMKLDAVSVSGSGIFIVAGGALLAYSLLTMETRSRYGMNKVRAGLYALSVGLMLFGMFSAVVTGLATGKLFIAITSLIVFFLLGFGVFLFLILTGSDRRKGH